MYEDEPFNFRSVTTFSNKGQGKILNNTWEGEGERFREQEDIFSAWLWGTEGLYLQTKVLEMRKIKQDLLDLQLR